MLEEIQSKIAALKKESFGGHSLDGDDDHDHQDEKLQFNKISDYCDDIARLAEN